MTYCKCGSCTKAVGKEGDHCDVCTMYCMPYIGNWDENENRRVIDLKSTFGDNTITKCVECWLYKSPCHTCLEKLNGRDISSLIYTVMSYSELLYMCNKFYSGMFDLPDTYSEYLEDESHG
jgi:hypothetical protein